MIFSPAPDTAWHKKVTALYSGHWQHSGQQWETGQEQHWPYVGYLYWQWDGGRHGEVPLGHCRRNGFLGPAWASPSLLLVFFGKCRWLCFFPGFPLLLVLNFTGAVPSQEIILWERNNTNGSILRTSITFLAFFTLVIPQTRGVECKRDC